MAGPKIQERHRLCQSEKEVERLSLVPLGFVLFWYALFLLFPQTLAACRLTKIFCLMPIFGSCSVCCSGFTPSCSRHNLWLPPRPPNLGAAGFADLRLARTYHCEIHPFCPARRGSGCCSSEFRAFGQFRCHLLAQGPHG